MVGVVFICCTFVAKIKCHTAIKSLNSMVTACTGALTTALNA